MKDIDTQLPELMTRATEGLEPESVDLVERSVAQGLRARQRRAAGGGVAAGVAVLATAAVVVGAFQHFDRRGQVAPAGPLVVGPTVTPLPTRPMTSTSPPTANPKDPTLLTLRSLLKAPGRTLSAPESWGGEDDGFLGAAWVVDDGKGRSQVTALLQRMPRPVSCKNIPGCTVRPDGSTIRSQSMGPEGAKVVSNFVEITRKDGRFVSLTSYNAPSEKDSKPTRAAPLLTVAQLTRLADSQAWKFRTTLTEK
ncbi:hypothetical protein ACFCV3_02020 [Kribbella sp. NPDC056345]|uniref:hypothetical protein n=1 Tax=Kribbella sp. NPDC056345 TaxID=3345789 RepID=UPI0035D5A02D